jgi:uncharacterized protein YdhG (YjbR/CyaY superfamily)
MHFQRLASPVRAHRDREEGSKMSREDRRGARISGGSIIRPPRKKQMTAQRPATIDDYIRAAPPEGQPHLRRLYALLKSVAPDAEEAIKWGTPFFVEPRFLFAFSAHKAHLNFTPTAAGLEPFSQELQAHKTTKGMLQLRYDEPLPEALIRKMAEHRVRTVREREDDAFW